MADVSGAAPDALVGWSGLVGGSLRRRREFDVLVNSGNPEALSGEFGTVVFSAARAEKWRANADPEADSRHVADLETLLGRFTCDRLVLISTVDVYREPIGVDEDSPTPVEGLHAYGAHRLRLEGTARRLHDRVTVARLPALFGAGLKKNVVFDLLHGNQLDRIQPASEFQYYDLDLLHEHLVRAVEADLDLVNLATEPIRTGDVMREVFGMEPQGSDAPVVRYDMRSRRAEALGGRSPYVLDRGEVIERLRAFVAEERR